MDATIGVRLENVRIGRGLGNRVRFAACGTVRFLACRSAPADDPRFAVRAMEAKLLFERHRISGHQNRSPASVADDVTPRVKVQHLHAGSASAREMDHRLGNLEQFGSRSYDNYTSILVRPAAAHQGSHHAPRTKVQTRGRSLLHILTEDGVVALNLRQPRRSKVPTAATSFRIWSTSSSRLANFFTSRTRSTRSTASVWPYKSPEKSSRCTSTLRAFS